MRTSPPDCSTFGTQDSSGRIRSTPITRSQGQPAAEAAVGATHFTIPDLWRRSARVYADRLAVVSTEIELTYRELDERTNRLAHALAAKGLARGDGLAVLATTRPEYVEVYFAAAKLSVTVVALNIRQAPDDLEHCLALTEPRLLFAAPHLTETAAALPGIEEVLVFGDDYERVLGAASADPFESAA